MSPTIKHPENLTGSAIGLDFVDGVAKTASLSKEAEAILVAHGYKVEAEKVIEIPDGDPTDRWTADQIKNLAKRDDLDLGEAKGKPELLAAITKAIADKNAAATTPPAGAQQ